MFVHLYRLRMFLHSESRFFCQSVVTHGSAMNCNTCVIFAVNKIYFILFFSFMNTQSFPEMTESEVE